MDQILDAGLTPRVVVPLTAIALMATAVAAYLAISGGLATFVHAKSAALFGVSSGTACISIAALLTLAGRYYYNKRQSAPPPAPPPAPPQDPAQHLAPSPAQPADSQKSLTQATELGNKIAKNGIEKLDKVIDHLFLLYSHNKLPRPAALESLNRLIDPLKEMSEMLLELLNLVAAIPQQNQSQDETIALQMRFTNLNSSLESLESVLKILSRLIGVLRYIPADQDRIFSNRAEFILALESLQTSLERIKSNIVTFQGLRTQQVSLSNILTISTEYSKAVTNLCTAQAEAWLSISKVFGLLAKLSERIQTIILSPIQNAAHPNATRLSRINSVVTCFVPLIPLLSSLIRGIKDNNITSLLPMSLLPSKILDAGLSQPALAALSLHGLCLAPRTNDEIYAMLKDNYGWDSALIAYAKWLWVEQQGIEERVLHQVKLDPEGTALLDAYIRDRTAQTSNQDRVVPPHLACPSEHTLPSDSMQCIEWSRAYHEKILGAILVHSIPPLLQILDYLLLNKKWDHSRPSNFSFPVITSGPRFALDEVKIVNRYLPGATVLKCTKQKSYKNLEKEAGLLQFELFTSEELEGLCEKAKSLKNTQSALGEYYANQLSFLRDQIDLVKNKKQIIIKHSTQVLDWDTIINKITLLRIEGLIPLIDILPMDIQDSAIIALDRVKSEMRERVPALYDELDALPKGYFDDLLHGVLCLVKRSLTHTTEESKAILSWYQKQAKPLLESLADGNPKSVIQCLESLQHLLSTMQEEPGPGPGPEPD